MTTYLFYDIETSGLHKPFDQILQFAAIRTDEALNEIERHNFFVKLNADTVPSPQALLTHRISFETLTTAMNEYEAIQKIHHIINQPKTISLGYNTLGFDDEFLRFSFYRNLLPPYTHQYANQCQRMDIFPITLLYFLFRNEQLQWPKINNKYSFKLENLCIANQLAEGAAHDAMVDVEATLALARIFYKDQKMWGFITQFFNKQTDILRIQRLQSEKSLLIDSFFGLKNNFCSIGIPLGQHHHYKNQTVWLRLDHANITNFSTQKILETHAIVNKKYGEPCFVLPLLPRFIEKINQENQQLSIQNWQYLKEHPELLEEIRLVALSQTYQSEPNTDANASLYMNGFWTLEEQNQCKEFHLAEPANKVTLVNQFKNPTLYTLAIRLLGRHFSDYLSTEQKSIFKKHLLLIDSTDELFIAHDYQGKKRLTYPQAFAELSSLSINDEQNHYLLSQWYSSYSQFLEGLS